MSDALFRLIGDGDRHSGGAIPLPDAFTVVVNELLDHGSADFRRLNHLISDVLKWKEERIMAAAWRTWPQFTHDVLTCLSTDMNLIKENEYGWWVLTEEFVPGHKFMLPGTDIGFTGRKYEDRIRREHNERVYLRLKQDVKEFQEGTLVALDQSGEMNPAARKFIEDAVKLLGDADNILTRELGLDQPETLTKDQIYYRKTHPRKPHERGKRLRSGMTQFFREFWEKHAVEGEWYSLYDIALKFNELHPEQPPINHSDLTGSMRKLGREMSASGMLESQWVIKNGARKWEYRKKVNYSSPGYAHNTAVMPVVTWEGLRKGDPKV